MAFRAFIEASRSARIWFAIGVLTLIWLPLLGMIRLLDRTPNHLRTGLWFRKLGRAYTRVNPAWRLVIEGDVALPPGGACVVVSNHQSLADIPLISNLPWEMKWVAKEELFRLPVIGWMMKLAGDLSVDRSSARSGALMMRKAMQVLAEGCPVIFFPEGTRSRDGEVGKFTDGAFHLAIKAGVPVLPLAIEGSGDCLPKSSWVFGKPADIRLKVFGPVSTAGRATSDAAALREEVRGVIVQQIASWRRV
jgi:1-acyl-sn-glycerol-3-phosphate acyltransferase